MIMNQNYIFSGNFQCYIKLKNEISCLGDEMCGQMDRHMPNN